MIFHCAGHGIGDLCPRKSYSDQGTVSAGFSVPIGRVFADFGSNSAGWRGYMPRNRTILSGYLGACPKIIFLAPGAVGLNLKGLNDVFFSRHTETCKIIGVPAGIIYQTILHKIVPPHTLFSPFQAGDMEV